MSVGWKHRIEALLLVGGMLLPCLQPSESFAAGFGSLAGVVSDGKGVPLMGATVLIMGPTAFSGTATTQTVEHMVTDAHGRFTVAHLVPGWYSLKVSSPTRLPEMRNRVRVGAGETVVASFVLTDTFAPIRFQVPVNTVSSWGDDWKWVLRTSSNTRPILRFHETPQTTQTASQAAKVPLLPSERIAGYLPETAPHDPLAEDFGMASVFAYVQPTSADSEIVVAAAYAPSGMQTATVGAVETRGQLQGEPRQFGVVVHQFGLASGNSSAPAVTGSPLAQAKGLVGTYSETRLIAPKVTVTAGMDIVFLDAIDRVYAAQPQVSMEYQATPQTMVSAEFGSARPAGASSLMEQLGLLSTFPQITERNGRMQLEQLQHTQVALNRRVGKAGRVQAAAYHDNLHNAAVWALGSANGQSFVGNSLPNLAGNGLVINGGNYQSVGFRAMYAQTFDSRVEVLGGYSSGAALSARGLALQDSYSLGMLAPRRTNSWVAKITAELPKTHTRVSASYEWVPSDRVTMVDPARDGSLGVEPYLGVEFRQPIPTPNFLPLHIDAVADFQNLLSQGYVTAGQAGQKPVVLSSGYHAIRGGFSVQF